MFCPVFAQNLRLKSEEAMQEVLEYVRFVKEEEKELEKLNYQQNTCLSKAEQ